jgi:hypothetical protein
MSRAVRRAGRVPIPPGRLGTVKYHFLPDAAMATVR